MRVLLLTTTFLAVFFCGGLAHGQSRPDSVAYKTNLNYNILPFLSDPGSANFGLLLRLQKPDNRALRLGASLGLGTSTSDPSTGAKAKNSSYSSNISVGYEWQKPKNKLVFYYGPEVGLGYGASQWVNAYTPVEPDYRVKTESKNRSFSASAGGFVGVRWNILSQLSISVETALTYSFYHSKWNSKDYTTSSMNAAEVSGDSHNVSFRPIRAIYIGYHF